MCTVGVRLMSLFVSMSVLDPPLRALLSKPVAVALYADLNWFNIVLGKWELPFVLGVCFHVTSGEILSHLSN